MTEAIEKRLEEMRKGFECFCPARLSGVDEEEYKAHGCPNCTCPEFALLDALEMAMDWIKLQWCDCIHLPKDVLCVRCDALKQIEQRLGGG